MSQIRFRFRETLDRVPLRQSAVSQTGDLRKDVPHPMRPLAAASNLGERSLIVCILCSDKPLEIEGVVVHFQSSPIAAIVVSEILHVVAQRLSITIFSSVI